MEKDEISPENLPLFLEQTIDQAIARHRIELTPPAREYLLEMLERFAADFELYQEQWLTPVTFQYQRLMEETDRLWQKQLGQELGDRCLFLVGYFYEFVRRSGDGQVEYHSQIGSTAYQQTKKGLLVELAENFTNLYLVIGDLHLSELDDPEKLMEVYQKWEKTKDRYYASLLLGKGIMPQRLLKGN